MTKRKKPRTLFERSLALILFAALVCVIVVATGDRQAVPSVLYGVWSSVAPFVDLVRNWVNR